MARRAPLIPKLDKEVVLQAAKLSAPEARFLVANYYQSQEMRKRSDMQVRHLGDRAGVVAVTEDGAERPMMAPMLSSTAASFALIEHEVAKALNVYAEGSLVGRWCMSHVGIGPVITAGLLAHLDITKAETAGHFWSFAGLNPTMKWEKGQKRPFNRELKQLCFHLGECIKRTHNHPDSYYGPIYRHFKEKVIAKNEAGANAERAKTFRTNSSDVRAKLKEGKLPDGNLDRQACNQTVKIFLSHLQAVMWWDKYNRAPPKPFAEAHLGHAHMFRIPNLEYFPGFGEAYYGFQQAAE